MGPGTVGASRLSSVSHSSAQHLCGTYEGPAAAMKLSSTNISLPFLMLVSKSHVCWYDSIKTWFPTRIWGGHQTGSQWEREQKPRKCHSLTQGWAVFLVCTHLCQGGDLGGRQMQPWIPLFLPNWNVPGAEKVLVQMHVGIPGSLPVICSWKRATYSSQFLNHAKISTWHFLHFKGWRGKSLAGRVKNESCRNRLSFNTLVSRQPPPVVLQWWLAQGDITGRPRQFLDM